MAQLQQTGAKITATGFYVPSNTLTNHDLEQMVDTSDEWITKRTGISERRISAENEFTSDLSIQAIQHMLDREPVQLADVDMILVATSTPDYSFPSVASQIQAHFDIKQCGVMDLSAACAGFVYGLNMANALIISKQARKVLVIGAETLSKVTDYTDRTTCILFGDGAGCALVEETTSDSRLLHANYGTYGEAGKHLYLSHLSTQMNGQPLPRQKKITQNGREVYRLVVSTLSQVISTFIEQSGYRTEEIDWFIPHSANRRMIDAMCDRLGIEKEKALFSGTYYGNTSTATIPIALTEALQAQKIKQGDLVLFSGFGGGFTYSNTLVKW